MSNLNLVNYPNSYNDLPSQVKIGNQTVETYAYKNTPQRKVVCTVNPTTAISSNILNGSQIDFRIESGLCDRISGVGVQLRVAYNNTSGANCVVAIPEAWLANIQIYSNNGSTLLYQHTNEVEQYLINCVTLSRNEHENSAAIRGTSANYATGVLTVPNGQSGYLYVNIAPLFFKSLHLRPYSIDGQFLIRLTFNSGASNISSGSWTTNEAVLRVTGFEEPEGQKKMVLSRAMLPKNFFYYAPQRHIETMTLAANSQYTIRMSGLQGYANQIFFILRSTANINSPNNHFSFARVKNFELLDESNVSIVGFNPIEIEDMLISYGHQYDNLFLLNTNAHVWSFSQSPIGDLKLGTCNGGHFFNGFNSIRFTTRSDLVGGAYQIQIIALCNESMKVNRSVVSTTRS